MRLASSHKYTLTSSGRRQSSDGGVMRNTYEKNMKLYLYKNEIYEIKLLKIVIKERNVLKSTYYSK